MNVPERLRLQLSEELASARDALVDGRGASASFTPMRDLTRESMPDDDRSLRELYAYAAENRTRIQAHGDELERLRDQVRSLESIVAVLATLADEVKQLVQHVAELTADVSKLTRRVVPRPSANAWNALSGWAAFIVAVVAVIVAATR